MHPGRLDRRGDGEAPAEGAVGVAGGQQCSGHRVGVAAWRFSARWSGERRRALLTGHGVDARIGRGNLCRGDRLLRRWACG